MTDPNHNPSRDAVTTPVGVTTLCPQCGAAVPALETRCSTCGAQIAAGSDDEQRDKLRQRLQSGIGDAFELLDLLGKGGMGVVFRAREKALDREVALKVLAFDPLMVPEAFARFEREAKLAARLDHPNIVPIFTVGQGKGVAYYTMRIVRGGSLEDLLQRERKLDPARAVKYLREIASALDHAHANGIVHRDVKPANVMLGDGDHVFVADFGIARAVEGGGPALTSTGVVGSPAYMAPEQWQGQQIDGRSDQYALGILAYELLTGKRPYRDATMHELLRLHLTEELPDISQDLPKAAPAMGVALRKATSKDPNDRYATTGAFVSALELGAGTPIGAMAAVGANRSRAVTTPTKSSRAPAIAALVVVLGAGGVFAYTQLNKKPVVAPAPLVVHDTVVKTTKEIDTVRGAARVDTLRVPTPVPAAAVTAVTPPAVPKDSGKRPGVTPAAGRGPTAAVGAGPQAAGSGFIIVQHPLTQRGEVRIDSLTTIVGLQAVVIPVAPGPHTITYNATQPAGPTFPAQWAPIVRAGDTVRVSFIATQGGGPKGDSLRTRVAEQYQRFLTQRGRGGRLGRGRGGDE